MKKLILILLAQILMITVSAQRKGNFGVFLGGTYYMGDMNYGKHFYSPSFAGGALYRHDFDDRHAAKMSLYYGGLKGTFGGDAYRNSMTGQEFGSFSSQVLEIAMMYEFNFLPFNNIPTKENFTPYVSTGIGFAMIQNEFGTPNRFVWPMGLGIRYNINARMGVGCLWEMRMLFRDDLDGAINGYDAGTFHIDNTIGINNNDFYNFFGLYLTYKIFEILEDCPAYEKTTW